MIHKIPFRVIDLQDNGCHIMCSAVINGYKINILIDTGASVTVLDLNRIKTISPHQSLSDYHKSFTGVGSGSIRTYSTTIEEIIFGSFSIRNATILVIDLIHVNNAYASLDLDRVDGVMGGDLLMSLKARIDYAGRVLEIED
jgi:predicted aspartyl protease